MKPMYHFATLISSKDSIFDKTITFDYNLIMSLII